MDYSYDNSFPHNNIMVDNDWYNGTTLFPHRDISNHRFLGASEGMVLDYTVLAVVIFTLALILVIEVGRHKLDVWASGNPFFKTVLELMYRELTTLGMVECVIYLLHKYWEDFDLNYEVVFIDIHFMLFYTAVINAVQSSLVRVLTTRLTNKQWTMTEDIDIYHYVAIRKEFDRLEEQCQLDKSIPASVQDSVSGNGFFPENQKYFRSMIDSIAFRIRNPYLSSRKKALIVPVRFHELRAHFIESNNLPQKFKVSPYLNLSLTSVLLEFVHISPAAWILLMASTNILYFLSGAILDATGYTGSVTSFMIAVFFSVCTLFAVLQFLITLKMKSIFSHIINTKTWTARAAVDESMEEQRSREQLNLFWGGAPHYIIVATQYCQFGYAIGLAVIAVYNKELAKGDWVATMLFVWLASYGVFLFLVNRMMPWYTLCTSMGQLVNKERLHQTLAKLRLKEELRKKEAIHEEMKAEEEMERRTKEEQAKAEQASKAANQVHSKSSLLGITDAIVTNVGNVFKRPSAEERKRLRKGRQKSISDGVQFMRDFSAANTSRSFHDKGSASHLSDAAADKLVSVEEDQAFQQPPLVDNVDGQNNANPSSNRMPPPQPTMEERRKERRRLRKSQSENVAMMRTMTKDDFSALDIAMPRQRKSIANTSVTAAHITMPLSAPQRETMEQETQQTEGLNDHITPKEQPTATNIKNRHGCNDNTAYDEFLAVLDPPPAAAAPSSSTMTLPMSDEEDPEKRNNKDNGENTISRQDGNNNDEVQDESPRSILFNNHAALKEHLSPIKSEEEDPKERNNDDNEVSTPLRQNGIQNESPSVILPSPPILSAPKDDFWIPSGRRSSREDGDAGTPHGTTDASEILDRKQQRRRRRNVKSQSEGVAFMRSTLADTDNVKKASLASVCELGGDAQLETLAGLAKLSAKDLPEIPPFEAQQQTKSPQRFPSEKRRRPRPRHRSASDGVAAMAGDYESLKLSFTKTLLVSNEENHPTKPTPDTCLDKDQDQDKPSNRVSFAMFHNSPSASKALSIPTDRLSSIDSAASDDGDSDIDDVPDALPGDISVTPSKHMFTRPRIDLASFLESAKYRAASFLYGPMICLFVIGMRVEVFNIKSGVLNDQRNTYHMPLKTSFFVECSWYCLMMLEMCSVFTYFVRQACLNVGKGYATMKSVTAAGWGFLINVLCLLLLLIAEKQRCCYPSSPDGQSYEDGKSYEEMIRSLGAAEEEYGSTNSYESYYPSDETDKCTCMKFGSRLYGGLGNIEPFTCLIVLSPLRFIFASYTLRMFGYRRVKHDQVSHASDQNHGSHDAFDMKTKARELWLSTVGAHSDVAIKFGIFSGQFLQCMLGIEIGDEEVEEPSADMTDKDVGSSQPFNEPSIQNNAERELLSLTSLDSTSDTPKQPHQRRTAYDFDSFGVVFDDFSYPSSRLIRRMRRCERRLLPFLDEWQVVDVVLTNHEIVLFDVYEESDYAISGQEFNLSTNGGKGLRLCDVAKGRKILSQFDLDDIDFVDIEHRLATVSDSTNDIESGHEQLLEFWQGGNDHIDGYRSQKMNLRWCNVNEDRLKVHFKSGGGTTLFMRFTVDLKEMERRKLELHAGEELSDIGRQAKVWCRSIAHLRGANNLTRMSLPHFNDDHEMDDFIELCPREEEAQEGRLKTLLRRNTSFAFDEQTLARINGTD